MKNLGSQSPTTFSAVLVGLGFVVLFLGWNGAAGVDFVSGQMPYVISGGLVGVGLIAAGLTAILVQTNRRNHEELLAKLDDLVDRLGTSEADLAELSPRARRALEARQAN